MSKESKPSPGSDAHFPKTFSVARNRALKRSALWIGGISATVFAVVLLFGGIAGGSQGFTTRIERGSSIKNVVLRTSTEAEKDEDGVYYLYANGLANAKPTSALAVADWCKTLYAMDNLSGENIMENDSIQYAFAYTFYLQNVSDTENQTFTFYISLDSYVAPTNAGATNPYSYLRLMVFVNDANSSSHNHVTYAAANDLGQGTIEGGKDDLRECLAEAKEVKSGDAILRQPIETKVPVGENPYCTSFNYNEKEIIRNENTILANATLRYTILAYFEGEDPDCARGAPNASSISFSAHFGD